MAGINTPSFFTEGEKTPGNVNNTHANPITHTIDNIVGLFVFFTTTNTNYLRMHEQINYELRMNTLRMYE